MSRRVTYSCGALQPGADLAWDKGGSSPPTPMNSMEIRGEEEGEEEERRERRRRKGGEEEEEEEAPLPVIPASATDRCRRGGGGKGRAG